MNNLYQELNKNNIVAQFEQFKKNFTGDPRAEVQKLLDSGRMSQDNYARLSQQATTLMTLLGIK